MEEELGKFGQHRSSSNCGQSQQVKATNDGLKCCPLSNPGFLPRLPTSFTLSLSHSLPACLAYDNGAVSANNWHCYCCCCCYCLWYLALLERRRRMHNEASRPQPPPQPLCLTCPLPLLSLTLPPLLHCPN